MTPEERQVITAIFERLKAAENQPRDPEAERLIADLVARQPYAPYAMAQAIYVGEQALANLGKRIEGLERELQEAKEQAQEEAKAQAKPQSGGFLSSLFGGGRPEPEPGRGGPSPWGNQAYGQQPPPRGYAAGPQAYPPGGPGYPPAGPAGYPAAQPGPWGGAPQGGGGGFLQSAMSTAAGVAGGVVLGNLLTGAFSHHGGSGFGSGYGGFTPDSAGQSGAAFGGQDSGGQDSGGQDSGRQDFGGDAIDHGDAASRGLTDAAYDRSQDYPSHEDSPIDHGSDNDAGFADDSGFSGNDDPGGFSGDV
jgi:hypothetical protein